MKYRLEEITAKITVDEYMRDYRDPGKFIEFCKQCDRYGTSWACPPFDFNTTELLKNCRTAYIIGTKIIPDDAFVKGCVDPEECKGAAYRIIDEVRAELDKILLIAEKKHPGSRAFFAGNCRLCHREKCTRIVGQPCLYPDRIRSSLESFGFDIGKTSSELLNVELKWSREGRLPEYFMLVSGLFTV